jgi:hypothetical protein
MADEINAWFVLRRNEMTRQKDLGVAREKYISPSMIGRWLV